MSIQTTHEQEVIFCDQVSLQKLNAIQPHGVLFVIDATNLTILQVSENVESLLPYSAASLISNTPFTNLLTPEAKVVLQSKLNKTSTKNDRHTWYTQLAGIPCWLQLHPHSDYYLVECELSLVSSPDFLNLVPILKEGIQRIKSAQSIQQLADTAVQLFQEIGGHDKVMIYKFDHEWCGLVIAETKDSTMESYLGLKFPATDIPKQARKFFQTAGFRYIPTIRYTPAALTPAVNPLTKTTTDLTFCQLRTVAPVHIEYLNNMEIESSTSFSLMFNDELWGLITCHHRSAKYLAPEIQNTLSMLSECISSQIFLSEEKNYHIHQTKALAIQSKLTDWMFHQEQLEQDFSLGLVDYEPNILEMVSATGAAIYLNGYLRCVGEVPKQIEIKQLINWLEQVKQPEVFITDRLPNLYPESKNFEQVGCGLMALHIAQNTSDYILFFRPALAYTVKWAGNPDETINFEKEGRHYHPRNSFRLWEETVQGRSLPWQDYEIEAANRLRNSVVDRLLHQLLFKQATELDQRVKKRTIELERSNNELEQFAYVSSHQLKEPLRMVSGFTQLLAQRHQANFDAESQEFMKYIIDGAVRMQQLIDEVLAFSQIGKQQKLLTNVSAEVILKIAIENLQPAIQESSALITYDDKLPAIPGEQGLLVQLFQNLLSNAIKFRGKNEVLCIHIGVKYENEQPMFFIRDNGIGIEPQYHERIFKLFHQLHTKSEYDGTGIGLAVCKKIVEYFGGKIWLESELEKGSIFYFTFSVSANK